MRGFKFRIWKIRRFSKMKFTGFPRWGWGWLETVRFMRWRDRYSKELWDLNLDYKRQTEWADAVVRAGRSGGCRAGLCLRIAEERGSIGLWSFADCLQDEHDLIGCWVFFCCGRYLICKQVMRGAAFSPTSTLWKNNHIRPQRLVVGAGELCAGNRNEACWQQWATAR